MNVTEQLCMEIRFTLERLASDLGGGTFRDKLQRSDLEGWERAKYQDYWQFACEGTHGQHGNQKGRCNEILQDLKSTQKF